MTYKKFSNGQQSGLQVTHVSENVLDIEYSNKLKHDHERIDERRSQKIFFLLTS